MRRKAGYAVDLPEGIIWEGSGMRLAVFLCLAGAVAGGAMERTKPDPQAQVAVRLSEPKPKPNGLTVYSEEGYKVADCAKSDHDLRFSDCKIE